MTTRHTIPIIASIILLGGQASADDLWAGAGGAPVPVDDGTPIVLELLAVSFTAVPAPNRQLHDPRFAEQWEISSRLDLLNPTDREVSLTLAVPEMPAEPGAAGPHVREMVISLDGLRLRIVPRRFDDLPDIGLSCEAFRSTVVDFAPGQRRRIDIILRQPAPSLDDGSVVARWLGGGLDRFSGETIPVQRLSWHFGDRVRLRRDRCSPALDRPGARVRFFDNGWRSRIDFETRNQAPLTSFDIAAEAAGPGRAPDHLALPGAPRPVADMNRAELVIARALLLAVHGRMLGDVPEARLFEDLAWGPGNPAFRLARGEPLPDLPVETLIADARCPAGCRRIRSRPVDLFGDPWADPLCWYSPDHNRVRTDIRAPEWRAMLADIERRLSEFDAAGRRAAGCGCASRGSRRGAGWFPLLLELLAR